MKQMLIKNYWLIILGWCMFLNNYSFLGLLLSLAGSFLTLISLKRINYMRIGIVCLFIYVTVVVLLFNTSIPYFFPGSYIFMFGVSLDAATTYEKTLGTSLKRILPIDGIMLICVLVLSLIISIVPSSIYSIFTKHNLFLMDMLIFLPYKLPLTICVVKKGIRNYKHNTLNKKVITSM